MFYGQGAGGAPTASAVLGDLVAVARNRLAGGPRPGESAYADLPVRRWGDGPTRYHVSLDVADRAGVLALGRGRVRPPRREHPDRAQEGAARGDGDARVVVTHTAPPTPRSPPPSPRCARPRHRPRGHVSVMRVEGGEE